MQIYRNALYLHSQNSTGGIAQSVEQRTENPCVPGSIPGEGTKQKSLITRLFLFYYKDILTYFELEVNNLF